MELSEIGRIIGATIARNGPPVDSLATLEDARAGQLSFCAGRRYEHALSTTGASALILTHARPELEAAQLIHPDPLGAFIQLLPYFQARPGYPGGISSGAWVSPEARLEEGVSVGPGAVIEAGARVGAHTTVAAGCYLGTGAAVGEGGVLHPRVVVLDGVRIGRRVVIHSGTVVGSDGFGFRWDGSVHRKIPQLGTVVIGDDVEIGANCTIDRAMVGETAIGAGTRIDNLVHVGHNVRMGEGCLLVAQVGLSGSVRLGNGVTLAGQVGVADHVTIGAGAVVAAQAGVHSHVPPGATVAGTPDVPVAVWRRVSAALPRLPELLKRVRRLERGGTGEP